MTAPFLEFDPILHRYYCDAIELASVTTILKLAGVTSGFGSDADMERGRNVHKICELDDQGGVDLRKVSKELRGYLHGWRSYKAISGWQSSHVEHRVWSPEWGYAGTIDRIGTRRNGKHPVILDIKSSKQAGSPADSVRYQTAAYGHAFAPGKIFERIAVAVRPDGTFGLSVWDVDTYKRDVSLFIGFARSVKNNYHTA
jgi:hypothetical protein